MPLLFHAFSRYVSIGSPRLLLQLLFGRQRSAPQLLSTAQSLLHLHHLLIRASVPKASQGHSERSMHLIPLVALVARCTSTSRQQSAVPEATAVAADVVVTRDQQCTWTHLMEPLHRLNGIASQATAAVSIWEFG